MDIIDEFRLECGISSWSESDDKLFILACKLGNLQVAYTIKQKNPNVIDLSKSQYAFEVACVNGQLLLAQWLLSEVPTIDNHKTAFFVSCSNGHVHVAEWILKVKPTIDIKQAFRYACVKGRIKCVKWLYLLNKVNIQDYATSSELFRDCCLNEQFEVCRWLLKKSSCDIKKIDAFIHAIYESNLRAVKWLYKIHPACINTISISIPMVIGSNTQLNIVKWLLKTNPLMFNERQKYEAFYKACEYNKVSVAQWLYGKYKFNDAMFQDAYKNAQQQRYHHCRDIIDWMERVWLKHHKPKIAYLDVGIIETCPVCQEDDCEIQTACNHTFCKTCINTWFQNHTTCPYCRENVKYAPVHTLRLKKIKTTLQQLKQLCKENKLKNYSQLKKDQLVQLLRENNIQFV